MAKALAEYDDEYGSITDRSYKLKRRGEGLDTEYIATPLEKESPSDRLKKIKRNSDGLLRDSLNALLSIYEDDTVKPEKEEEADESLALEWDD